MRRASTCLALLGLAVLGLPVLASAAPVVTLKAKAVPIPGFPHTGDILGAGAALQTEWTIKGTEYGGFPPPLIGVNFYLPVGTKLHPQGFATCSTPRLKNSEPRPSEPGVPGEVENHDRGRSERCRRLRVNEESRSM